MRLSLAPQAPLGLARPRRYVCFVSGLELDEDKAYQPDALVVMSEPYHGIWLGFANMLSVTVPKPETAAGTTEVELAWSPDLKHWKYVAHGTPFIYVR